MVTLQKLVSTCPASLFSLFLLNLAIWRVDLNPVLWKSKRNFFDNVTVGVHFTNSKSSCNNRNTFNEHIGQTYKSNCREWLMSAQSSNPHNPKRKIILTPVNMLIYELILLIFDAFRCRCRWCWDRIWNVRFGCNLLYIKIEHFYAASRLFDCDWFASETNNFEICFWIWTYQHVLLGSKLYTVLCINMFFISEQLNDSICN